MKKFNVTGLCVPEKHYMVDISQKLNQIIAMIESDEYFTINRARQYGKTTTFSQLDGRMKDSYTVLRLSFEGVGNTTFENDETFIRFFVKKVADELKYRNYQSSVVEEWSDMAMIGQGDAYDVLSDKITKLCGHMEKEIIVMIDEVDKSSDNQVFLNFLGMLRSKYLLRQEGRDITFKSVILAGVYDVKNLKLKLRTDEEKKYNSPWNIAADFDVDMSFSAKEIETMLSSYEQDYHTGMDVEGISEAIRFYTGGYPYLVSRLCKWVDEKGERCWNIEGVKRSVREVLKEKNVLFDDLIKNVENYSDLKQIVRQILLNGRKIPFSFANTSVELGAMFGILSSEGGFVCISNIIFETYLYNHMIIEELLGQTKLANKNSSLIIDGKLNMPRVLEKFQEIMKAEYRVADEPFIESHGRLLFLCFLKPIINGAGFYYVEPETRDDTRMDIVVAYGGEECIVELKIWHGEKKRVDAIRQLEGYMDSRNAQCGYLISFSFLKKKKYKSGWLGKEETDKDIFEVIV